MLPATALASLRALCDAPLPADTLVPALLEGLHGLVPSARNLFDWTDADGRLLRYHVEGPVDAAVAQLYFEEFHNRRETEAMLPFQALRARRAGVYGAEELDRPGFHETALYHEIWKPQGLHTRIEAVLRGRSGGLLGSLVLYRGPREPAFTAAERQRLARVLPMLAQALEAATDGPGASAGRQAGPDDAPVPAPGPGETLLVSMDGRIGHASPGALALLLVADGGMTPEALRNPRHAGAGLLGGLLAQLRQAPPGGPAVLRRQAADGLVLATAQRLDALPASGGGGPEGSAMVLVSLRRQEPRRVALERALRGLPLTPGQLAVCRALYQGAPQARIAAELGVAPSTVVDHVRKAYRALDLHSAAGLRALLDARIAQAAG